MSGMENNMATSPNVRLTSDLRIRPRYSRACAASRASSSLTVSRRDLGDARAVAGRIHCLDQ